MKKISDIDKNFAVKTEIKRDGLKFHSVFEETFSIHGVIYENGCFRRMPQDIADRVNDGVNQLNLNTAGGRIRFITDSDYVAVNVKYNGVGKMPHFAITGSAGLDLYTNEGDGDIYAGTFMPPFDVNDRYESVIDLGKKERLITVNMPTYSGIKELYIGLRDGCTLKKAPAYRNALPVVFYGSSITQGGCCSRPGNTYQQILSRELNFDYVNLGFSGSARAEDVIADYIAGLDMSVFVYDYDHNAPNTEHLEATHEKMFKKIRAAHPELPVVMLTRPKFHLGGDEDKRLEIVKRTYENAVKNGDKNVYFIPGPQLIGEEFREVATVDNCHPNDAGFLSMALALKPLLCDLLK